MGVMGLAGAWAEASEALQTQINAAVMVNTRVIVRLLECGSHRSDEYDRSDIDYCMRPGTAGRYA